MSSTDTYVQARSGLRVALSVLGIISVVVGVLVLMNPAEFGKALGIFAAVLLGVFTVVAGISYALSAFFTEGASFWSRALRFVVGIVALVAGVVLLMNPASTAVFIWMFAIIMIGITWISEGIIAFMELGEAPSKGWVIFYAVISLIAGVMMVIAPFTGAAVMVFFIGISAIVWGVTEIVGAIRFGK
ncbi:MAG: DUF308 domain-containing protein [Scrofimicrobium sp.]